VVKAFGQWVDKVECEIPAGDIAQGNTLGQTHAMNFQAEPPSLVVKPIRGRSMPQLIPMKILARDRRFSHPGNRIHERYFI